MVKFTVCIAEKTILINALYESTLDFCKDYICDCQEPDISVSVSPFDIEAERQKSAKERSLEGLEPHEFPKPYLETLALYRKIAEALSFYDIILFHGSSISMDGDGYIFTAKSGTGKSTHTRLWRKVFGNRVQMINDDKPLIRISNGEVRIFGTPWCGKHGLGANISAPIKGIAIIERAEENTISPVSRYEALPKLLSQTFRPVSAEALRCVISLLDKLAASVPVYRLRVNMKDEAAQIAYLGMKNANNSDSVTVKAEKKDCCV